MVVFVAAIFRFVFTWTNASHQTIFHRFHFSTHRVLSLSDLRRAFLHALTEFQWVHIRIFGASIGAVECITLRNEREPLDEERPIDTYINSSEKVSMQCSSHRWNGIVQFPLWVFHAVREHESLTDLEHGQSIISCWISSSVSFSRPWKVVSDFDRAQEACPEQTWQRLMALIHNHEWSDVNHQVHFSAAHCRRWIVWIRASNNAEFRRVSWETPRDSSNESTEWTAFVREEESVWSEWSVIRKYKQERENIDFVSENASHIVIRSLGVVWSDEPTQVSSVFSDVWKRLAISLHWVVHREQWEFVLEPHRVDSANDVDQVPQHRPSSVVFNKKNG